MITVRFSSVNSKGSLKNGLPKLRKLKFKLSLIWNKSHHLQLTPPNYSVAHLAQLVSALDLALSASQRLVCCNQSTNMMFVIINIM